MSEGQTSLWWRRIIHSGNNTRFSPPYCIHTLAHNALQARVTQKTQYIITTHLSHVSPVFHETLNSIFHLHKYLSENVLFQFFKVPISLSNSFKVTKCKVLNKCFLCVWGALLFNNFPLVRCPTKPYQRKKTCQPYKKVVYQVIYRAQNIVFHLYMKHLEKSWEYDMQQSILDELRGVSSSDETQCHMLDAS